MDLSKPMMSEEQKQEIVEIVNNRRFSLSIPKDLLICIMKIQLGNLIRNVEILDTNYIPTSSTKTININIFKNKSYDAIQHRGIWASVPNESNIFPFNP
jgi:hypothetical protein